MFLARLPDGSNEPQVYQVPDRVPVLDDDKHVKGYTPTMRVNTRRAWRYDSRALKPEAALRSSGYAAIDRTAEQAIWSLGQYKADEEYRAAVCAVH